MAMPIYEYECCECGTHFEKMQRIGDPEPVVCPLGHKRIRRRLSQPAIIFKGSGFYATDHGHNGATSSRRKRHEDKAPEPTSVPATEQQPAP
jgi:putative FmdB family regulatory protein